MDRTEHAESAYELTDTGAGGKFAGLQSAHAAQRSLKEEEGEGMKLVTAIIKTVQAGRGEVGVGVLWDPRPDGLGGQRLRPAEGHRGLPGCGYTVDLVPKIRVEVLVDSNDADSVVDVIVRRRRPAASAMARCGPRQWIRWCAYAPANERRRRPLRYDGGNDDAAQATADFVAARTELLRRPGPPGRGAAARWP